MTQKGLTSWGSCVATEVKSGQWQKHEVALRSIQTAHIFVQQKDEHQERGIIMKKTIVTLACALIAPLAFAQTSSTEKKQGSSTAETVTVTGTIIAASEEGAAANYQPVKTLVIREDTS